MRAGLLKEVIEIYQATEKKNDLGETNIEWEFKYETRAGIVRKGGSRTIENNEVIFPNNKQFLVRLYVPIAERDRIKYNNKFYRVLSIDDDKYYNDKVIETELIND